MAQANKICSICGEKGHSKFYCKKKPIKRMAVRKKIVKKVSKTDRAKAKEKAWKAFSAYIRTRDCINYTGSTEEGICVTCRAELPYSKLQAGHFVGGRGNAVLFDERIVYAQCGYCNQKPPMGLGGNYAAYTLFMIDEYGREKVEEFLKLRHQTKVYKLKDFIEIGQKYKDKTAELLSTAIYE